MLQPPEPAAFEPPSGSPTALEPAPRECTEPRRTDALLYLSRADVAEVALPTDVLLATVEEVLREKGLGRVESPPKRGVVPRPGASIRAMKAFVPSLQAAGVKWISAFPDNTALGLPTISGLLILNDVHTGQPTAVMDCAWITAMRTAACTAISARHLAHRESTDVGVVACGLQGRVNLRALCAELPVRTARAYDVRYAHAERFAAEMSAELGIEVHAVRGVEQAVRNMDVVVTSCPIEKDPRPTIDPTWISPGAFLALLDFDASLRPAAFQKLDRFVTDDARQLAFFKEIGYLRETPEPDADLGKIVAGRVPGRTSPTETIATMNLGIGVLDIAVASRIRERAQAAGIGTELPL